MKANAPEKLYISDSELNDSEHCIIWFKSQQNEKDIEYIREDAFIEKAVKYIANHFLVPGMDNEIKDFVNYMEGE